MSPQMNPLIFRTLSRNKNVSTLRCKWCFKNNVYMHVALDDEHVHGRLVEVDRVQHRQLAPLDVAVSRYYEIRRQIAPLWGARS
jgi:hypothetical protein